MAVFRFDIWKGNFYRGFVPDNYYTKTKIVGIIYVFLIHNVEISSQGKFFFKNSGKLLGCHLIFSKANQTRRTRFGFFLDIDFGFAILFFLTQGFLVKSQR